MTDWTPRPPIFPAEWMEGESKVRPLTKQTLDYALLAYEYGGAATDERYLEILAVSLCDGWVGPDDDR